MTLWGLGTGRCGTRSLAKDLGGVHEPKPWLGADAALAYHGDALARARCRQALQGRLALGVPVVDLHQSLVIPLICEIDPGAEFIWVVRHPMACVASFMTSNAWTKPHAWPTLWYPREGWPEDAARLDKAIWYWYAVNNIIERDLTLTDRPWQIRFTESLQAHENKYPKSELWRYSADEAAHVMDCTAGEWKHVLALAAA